MEPFLNYKIEQICRGRIHIKRKNDKRVKLFLCLERALVEEAKSKGIELLENTPCLEYLLISIINKKPSGKKSSWCKNEFKSRYFNKKKQSELSEYNKLFPKKLLDSKRLVIPQLDKLISIMEGK